MQEYCDDGAECWKNGIFNAFYIYFSELLSKFLSNKSQNLKK